MSRRERLTFLSKNLLRGFLWLSAIIVTYVLIREYVNIDFEKLLKPLNDTPVYVYLVFTMSEVLVGIIPPELFMIWASQEGIFSEYVASILLLSLLSYGAGVIGYLIGKNFANTRIYASLSERFFNDYAITLRRYGSFLILVAALTPLPFSGIAMVVGSTGYKFPKYLLVSLARFVRFAVYAYVIWVAV